MKYRPVFIEKNADLITPVIPNLINEPFASCSDPNLFKVTGVTPIHKSGFIFDFKNYSPISVLLFLNKVFERALHSRVSKFYDKYNVIHENQYGFLKNKSTTDAILIFRSVARHFIVKNTSFQSFSTSVRRLILFVMTFS